MASSKKYDRTWLEARKRAQADCLWFGASVLRYVHIYPPLHQGMVDFWLHPARHKLGLWSRGFFKSTFFSIIGPLWKIVSNLPDEPIFPPLIPRQFLLASERGENAEKFLNAINEHITRNETFQYLFPEIRPGKPWSQKMRNIQRAFDPTLKEFTFETAGLNSDPTSTHFTDIIGDDLVGFSNYGSKEGRDFVDEWWRATNPLLLPQGQRLLAMTRWDYDDIAGRVIRQNPELPENERYYIESHGCYLPNGHSAFPTVWPDDKIEAEKIHQGRERFSNWMENNPERPENRFFQEDRIFYWTKTADFDLILPKMEIGLLLDPASGVTDNADYHGIVIIGAWENIRYILRTEQGRWTWAELVQEVKHLCTTHNAKRLGVEVWGPGSAIMSFFETEYRRGGLPYPEKLQPNNRMKHAKEERVKGLIPHVEAGEILFHREQTELLRQVFNYPHVARDDLVDALSYVVLFMPFGGRTSVRPGLPKLDHEKHPGAYTLAYEPDDPIYKEKDSQQWWWN